MIKTNSEELQVLGEKIKQSSVLVDTLESEVKKVLVGQDDMFRKLLLGLLAEGHILLEGLPGLAKTLAIKTVSKAINARFSRIQFTPDLLPSDLVGTMIYNQKSNEFAVKKGPIFANFILADEINRAPAKVQSALLEAMQEKQVTIGEETFKLEEPFLVLATQNPIEQEGTYPLPEAQMDRFMLKVLVGYPKREEEQMIIRNNTSPGEVTISPVVESSSILEARNLVKEVYLDEKIEEYILNIVEATRNPSSIGKESLEALISYGGSPRASIFLALSAKANAYISHRAFVIPEDIRSVAPDVLRHRIGLTYEAEAENVTADQIIGELLDHVEVP